MPVRRTFPPVEPEDEEDEIPSTTRSANKGARFVKKMLSSVNMRDEEASGGGGVGVGVGLMKMWKKDSSRADVDENTPLTPTRTARPTISAPLTDSSRSGFSTPVTTRTKQSIPTPSTDRTQQAVSTPLTDHSHQTIHQSKQLTPTSGTSSPSLQKPLPSLPSSQPTTTIRIIQPTDPDPRSGTHYIPLHTLPPQQTRPYTSTGQTAHGDRPDLNTHALPSCWDAVHDRAIVYLDVRGYDLPTTITKLREFYPELGGGEMLPSLTVAMLDMRLRQLDQDLGVTYWWDSLREVEAAEAAARRAVAGRGRGNRAPRIKGKASRSRLQPQSETTRRRVE